MAKSNEQQATPSSGLDFFKVREPGPGPAPTVRTRPAPLTVQIEVPIARRGQMTTTVVERTFRTPEQLERWLDQHGSARVLRYLAS